MKVYFGGKATPKVNKLFSQKSPEEVNNDFALNQYGSTNTKANKQAKHSTKIGPKSQS